MRKAGHDLRAPLAAISSILSAIRDSGNGLSEDHAKLIERAQVRARGLMSLVEDLRRFSRLRAPGSLMQVKPFALDQTVGNTAELFSQQARSQGISLTCRAEPLTVEGDEQLIREVVTNLVANAIQYTPRDGHVDVRLSADDTAALLEIADTGIGISEKAREKLFSEFYRAPEAKKVFPDGTGLGLAICKQIVSMHAGDIEATARDEGGTVFTVRLPLPTPAPPA